MQFAVWMRNILLLVRNLVFTVWNLVCSERHFMSIMWKFMSVVWNTLTVFCNLVSLALNLLWALSTWLSSISNFLAVVCNLVNELEIDDSQFEKAHSWFSANQARLQNTSRALHTVDIKFRLLKIKFQIALNCKPITQYCASRHQITGQSTNLAGITLQLALHNWVVIKREALVRLKRTGLGVADCSMYIDFTNSISCSVYTCKVCH